jgi:ComF family protein
LPCERGDSAFPVITFGMALVIQKKRNVPVFMTRNQPLLATRRDLPSSLPRRIADGILNLIYPDSCIVCSAPVSRVQDCGICRQCWEKALQLRISGPLCPLCGLPYQNFAGEATHLCGKCAMSLPPYSGARAFGYYSSELSRMIQALKFDGRQNLAELLAPLMASTLLESWPTLEIDLVVPVPLHAKRKRERGYNQSALLTRSLARILLLPSCQNALIRVRSTLPQVGLSDSERARNLHRAFQCAKPAAVAGLHVLLIDDVMTTGSTVASAADALLEGGALRVSVLTAARTVVG